MQHHTPTDAPPARTPHSADAVAAHAPLAAAPAGIPGVVGVVIFLLGVGLVVYVFLAANGIFREPSPVVPTPAPAPSGSPGATSTSATGAAVSAIGTSLADLVRRLLVLLVMCLAGSAVATLGINLFFSARSAAANARDVAAAGGSPPVPPPPAAPANNGHVPTAAPAQQPAAPPATPQGPPPSSS